MIGDIPIFVAHDSADVWANQEIFMLDAEGNAEAVSGAAIYGVVATGTGTINVLVNE